MSRGLIRSVERTPGTAPKSSESVLKVILGSLLCALICVLGLIAVARCRWVRRQSSQQQQQQQGNWNKGLKKKTLKSLPRETYSEELSGKHTDCAICLTEFTSGEEVRVLPHCSHRFHVSCIDAWLTSRSSCPSCRQILISTAPRCHKCGLTPLQPAPSSTTAISSSSSSSSSSSAGDVGEADAKSKDHANTFLP